MVFSLSPGTFVSLQLLSSSFCCISSEIVFIPTDFLILFIVFLLFNILPFGFDFFIFSYNDIVDFFLFSIIPLVLIPLIFIIFGLSLLFSLSSLSFNSFDSNFLFF